MTTRTTKDNRWQQTTTEDETTTLTTTTTTNVGEEQRRQEQNERRGEKEKLKTNSSVSYANERSSAILNVEKWTNKLTVEDFYLGIPFRSMSCNSIN